MIGAAMTKKSKILNVTICCPGDVEREIVIAREVIDAWNQRHAKSTGWCMKAGHWSTDCAPTMAERGQAAINRQMIDGSGIIIAIFWTRLGTPTGLAGSGTEEEITRAMARDIRVMPYFSRLEAPFTRVDPEQMQKLETFRAKLASVGLPWTFNSRQEFRKLLENHLDIAVRDILAKCEAPMMPAGKKKSISQNAKGDGNIQSAGDKNVFKITMPNKPSISIERHPDHICPADQKRVLEWTDELAQLSEEIENKPYAICIKSWRSRLKNRFEVPRYDALHIDQMSDVKEWCLIEKAKLVRKAKRKSPGIHSSSRIQAIKAGMRSMGVTKEAYYPEIAARLKMKPFVSLKDLSATNLEKVYNMVRRDKR
jgi:hypothetical protein